MAIATQGDHDVMEGSRDMLFRYHRVRRVHEVFESHGTSALALDEGLSIFGFRGAGNRCPSTRYTEYTLRDVLHSLRILTTHFESGLAKAVDIIRVATRQGRFTLRNPGIPCDLRPACRPSRHSTLDLRTPASARGRPPNAMRHEGSSCSRPR